MIGARRQKVFGPGRAMPLDRNAKVRIAAYARAWSARNRRPGQHRGPITRAFLDVLQALLWQFHNAHTGCCFPSYQTIAARAGCARSTVAEALKVLEWAGVLTWQHRITRVRERCTDLFGRESWRWRVIRTSNAYVFRDPKAADRRQLSSKSENQAGTQDQEILDPVHTPARNPDSPIERALARFGAAVAVRKRIEQATGGTASHSGDVDTEKDTKAERDRGYDYTSLVLGVLNIVTLANQVRIPSASETRFC
jgi:hypothetical protein